jgi:hypothetical protein
MATTQPSRNIQDIPLLGLLQCSMVTQITLSIAYCGSSFEAVMRTKLALIKHFKNISRFDPRINEEKLFQYNISYLKSF